MKSRRAVLIVLGALALGGGIAWKLGFLEHVGLPAAARAADSAASAPDAAGGAADAGTAAAASESDAVPQDVTLSPDQQVLANVRTVAVRRQVLGRKIRTVGTVTFDQTRISHLAARLDGRLDRVAPLAEGDRIRRGQVVGAIYSPDLVSSERELAIARDAVARIGHADPEAAADSRAMLAAARQRLALWGLSHGQIAAIEAGKRATDIPVLAPVGGVVTTRKVDAGQYVKAGDPLFDLADLSEVWVEAAVHESDLAALRAGARVDVTAIAYPGRHWQGRVAQLSPALDARTRTLGVRVALANPDLDLRPQMNVTVAFAGPASAALAVPATAVIDTGKRKVVWVKTDDQTFSPRAVTLGALDGDVYPVLSGLQEGDKVAVSGGFLLDASAQLDAGQ